MKGYTADHIDYGYFIFCVFRVKLFQVQDRQAQDFRRKFSC